jgi:hypothetical protein
VARNDGNIKGKIMQNKKLYVILGVVILLVGVAAFVAGRMFNAGIGTVGLGGPNGGRVSISLNDITPAPELPMTRADITGLFVERKDNAIVVQAVSFGTGVGGVSGDSPLDDNSGIKVEIVVTGETTIYKDVTELPDPVNGEIHNVQQVVEEGTLDDLNSQSFITVWGRRSGDRIIADVLLYSNPQSIKKPGT